jgi:outer membrane protein assembly factor BamD (BamD/ComL family)
MNNDATTQQKHQLQQGLQKLTRKIFSWQQVAEDYPGTKFAQQAQVQIKALEEQRAQLLQEMKPA